jgi:ribonuclease PH
MAEGKITENPLTPVAAVSCGVVAGRPLLDLNYIEDRDAAVDMNVVMNGAGQFIEIQAAGEESTFSDDELAELLRLARSGVKELLQLQAAAIAS